jgi:hypothetical protein
VESQQALQRGHAATCDQDPKPRGRAHGLRLALDDR